MHFEYMPCWQAIQACERLFSLISAIPRVAKHRQNLI